MAPCIARIVCRQRGNKKMQLLFSGLPLPHPPTPPKKNTLSRLKSTFSSTYWKHAELSIGPRYPWGISSWTHSQILKPRIVESAGWGHQRTSGCDSKVPLVESMARRGRNDFIQAFGSLKNLAFWQMTLVSGHHYHWYAFYSKVGTNDPVHSMGQCTSFHKEPNRPYSVWLIILY